jgi:hypothetical protein
MNLSPRDLDQNINAWPRKSIVFFSNWGFHNILERRVLGVTTTKSLITARIFTVGYETTDGDTYHRQLMA